MLRPIVESIGRAHILKYVFSNMCARILKRMCSQINVHIFSRECVVKYVRTYSKESMCSQICVHIFSRERVLKYICAHILKKIWVLKYMCTYSQKNTSPKSMLRLIVESIGQYVHIFKKKSSQVYVQLQNICAHILKKRSKKKLSFLLILNIVSNIEYRLFDSSQILNIVSLLIGLFCKRDLYF